MDRTPEPISCLTFTEEEKQVLREEGFLEPHWSGKGEQFVLAPIVPNKDGTMYVTAKK